MAGTRIEGLKKLDLKLRRLAPAAMRAAREAVLDGAQEIANLQQNLVPYDQGELHDSIVVTPPGGTTPPYSQPGGSRKAGPEQAIITAGNSGVRYAHLVEYGASPHVNGGQFKGTLNPGTTAQPFFWPAYRALRNRVRGRITRTIKREIVKVVKAGGSNP